jgi:hypothetical protein
MKKYKITTNIEEEIEAKDEEEAIETFWDNVESSPQQSIVSFLSDHIQIKELKKEEKETKSNIVIELNNNERNIVILHESMWKSWLKDAWTFGCLFFVFLFNYFVFESEFYSLFTLVLWFIWIFAKSSKDIHNFYDKKSAKEFIDNIKL